MVSWKHLTLSEARGFITFYIIEYHPYNIIIENQRQSLDGMRMDVSALLSSTTIVDLDENLDYIIQVSASTSAGRGVASSPRVARTFQLSLPRDNTGAIVGGTTVVAVMLIVAAVIIVVVIVMRCGQKPNSPGR